MGVSQGGLVKPVYPGYLHLVVGVPPGSPQFLGRPVFRVGFPGLDGGETFPVGNSELAVSLHTGMFADITGLLFDQLCHALRHVCITGHIVSHFCGENYRIIAVTLSFHVLAAGLPFP